MMKARGVGVVWCQADRDRFAIVKSTIDHFRCFIFASVSEIKLTISSVTGQSALGCARSLYSSTLII